jgi:hypothetical protein
MTPERLKQIRGTHYPQTTYELCDEVERLTAELEVAQKQSEGTPEGMRVALIKEESYMDGRDEETRFVAEIAPLQPPAEPPAPLNQPLITRLLVPNAIPEPQPESAEEQFSDRERQLYCAGYKECWHPGLTRLRWYELEDEGAVDAAMQEAGLRPAPRQKITDQQRMNWIEDRVRAQKEIAVWEFGDNGRVALSLDREQSPDDETVEGQDVRAAIDAGINRLRSSDGGMKDLVE